MESARPLPMAAAYVAVALVAIGLSLAPAYGITLMEEHLPKGEELSPQWDFARDLLTALPAVVVLPLGLWLLTRIRRSLGPLRPLPRWVSLIALLALTCALAYGAVVAAIVTQPNWIFGPGRPQQSVASPDGSKVAHLRRSCFFGCSMTLFIQERVSPGMRQVGQFSIGEDALLPRIHWKPDSSAFVLFSPDDPRAAFVGQSFR